MVRKRISVKKKGELMQDTCNQAVALRLLISENSAKDRIFASSPQEDKYRNPGWRRPLASRKLLLMPNEGTHSCKIIFYCCKAIFDGF